MANQNMASSIHCSSTVDRPTQPQIPTNAFELEPEIYGDNQFVLDKYLNILSIAEGLAEEANRLLDMLKTTQPIDMQGQYQIELRKVNPHNDQCSTYKMSLRIDSVLWFKYHKLNNNNENNIKQLYEIGSAYVEKVKNETEHHFSGIDDHQIQRIPITNSTLNLWCKKERHGKPCMLPKCEFTHYRWCDGENRGKYGECTSISVTTDHKKSFRHFSHICDNNGNDDPVHYQCQHLITKLNREQVFCNFQVNPNFRIYADKVTKPTYYPYFIVFARGDPIPVVTLTPVKHCENEDYVQTTDAWQAVLLTLIYIKDQLKVDHLPLNRIYINFRKWMQQKADSPTHRYCHAHINIVLNQPTIKKINDLYLSKKKSKNYKILFPSLVGSVVPAKNHRLDGTWNLIEYMNNHMTPFLIKENQKLSRTISILQEEMKVLKEENERLQKSMDGSTPDVVEAEDGISGTDDADRGTGINDEILMGNFTLNLTDANEQ